VLLVRAADARDVVPEALRAAGRTVNDVAAYKTRLVVDAEFAEKAASADIWTFTSSSTVAGFLANVSDAAALSAVKIVACIGPVTAATAREAGLRVDVVADEFTVDGFVRALGTPVSA
jgi:uroporphyrinogen-III synthase